MESALTGCLSLAIFIQPPQSQMFPWMIVADAKALGSLSCRPVVQLFNEEINSLYI